MPAGKSALFLLLLPVGAAAHGSLMTPMPRNSVDRSLPPWQHGKFSPAGTIEPFGCDCTNGTRSNGTECDSALSCFWFSQGCTLGCSACSGNGSRAPNLDWCGRGPGKATNNDPRFRTLNRAAAAGSPEDVYKYNPWRAPGTAPVFDACGMAGGTTVPQVNGGEYPNTTFARQGDLGSKVLKPQPTGVVWVAGGVAEASFYIRANHGGGYLYRLAPAGSDLTEATFQKTPLDFASGVSRLRFADGREEPFNATLLRSGTWPPGSTWAMNPIPMCCPNNAKCTWSNRHTCGGGLEPNPRSPYVVPEFPFPAPGADNVLDFAVVDTLRVPEDLAPGPHVLSWRWDAEQTSQVWNACADVMVVARMMPT